MSGQLARIGLMASMASVLGSLYLYFVGEDEMLGIFVGLWAPTLILASKEIEANITPNVLIMFFIFFLCLVKYLTEGKILEIYWDF